MAYLRYVRRRLFERLRYGRKTQNFIETQAERLDSTASAVTFTMGAVVATAATGLLRLLGLPAAAETLTIGNKTYTFRAALTEAKATGVLTATTIEDGDTVTIGSRTYTFEDTLTDVNGNVKIGASLELTLTNLKNAINLDAGTAGVDYATSMVAHAVVDATASTATTVSIRAKAVGTAGNALASTDTLTSGGFAAATLLGGVAAVVNEIVIGADVDETVENIIAAIEAGAGEGTVYATGTVAQSQVDAAAGGETDEIDLEAEAAGAAGSLIEVSFSNEDSFEFEGDVEAGTGEHRLTGGTDASAGPTMSATAHGLSHAEGPYLITAATTAPTGSAGLKLWVAVVDANTFKLATSVAAIAAGEFVSFADDGTGALSLTKAVDGAGIFELLRRNKAVSIAAAADVDTLN